MKLRLRSRWQQMVLGLLAGIAVGAAVFGARQLHGAGLYLLTGAVAGAVAGLLLYAYSGNIELQEVVINIPQLSELHFMVAPDNRLVAWRLFIETTTRISTQPLADDSGKLREALTSLYNLFQSVRTSLEEARPSSPANGPTVEELGVAMLNLELRPFLSRWHPLLSEWEHDHDGEPERNWDKNLECRAELAALQQRVSKYVTGFAALAGLQSIEAWAQRASGGTTL